MAQLHQVFFSAPDPHPGSRVSIAVADAEHLFRVLRLHEGQSVRAVHRETGRVFESVLERIAGGPGLRLQSEIEAQLVPAPVSRLICAITKGKNPDLVCEKATELGVPSIVFVGSDHSVVILKQDAIEGKRDRYQRIAEAASKQSKQIRIPAVELFTSVDDYLAAEKDLDPALCLCCSLAQDASPLATTYRPGEGVQLFIGPEGDWSVRELELFRSRGFSLVSLGPHTLRSETAAIVGIAMVLALSAENSRA